MNQRFLIFISLLIIVPLGLLSKFYTGFGQKWIHDYSGDILYEIFWCLFVFGIIPQKTAITKIAWGVFAVTCIIEVSQLWFNSIPVTIRSSLIWRLLLGSTFVWWDFPHYALGSFLGWLWLSLINQKTSRN
ncbi:MAG: hypothetical protein Tsb0014_23400 [Pleurocapsa sp.]